MCMLTTIPPASSTKHETYLAQTVRRYLKLQIIFRSLGSKKFKGLGLIVTTQSAIIVLTAKYSNIGILHRSRRCRFVRTSLGFVFNAQVNKSFWLYSSKQFRCCLSTIYELTRRTSYRLTINECRVTD